MSNEASIPDRLASFRLSKFGHASAITYAIRGKFESIEQLRTNVNAKCSSQINPDKSRYPIVSNPRALNHYQDLLNYSAPLLVISYVICETHRGNENT